MPHTRQRVPCTELPAAAARSQTHLFDTAAAAGVELVFLFSITASGTQCSPVAILTVHFAYSGFRQQLPVQFAWHHKLEPVLLIAIFILPMTQWYFAGR